MDELRQLRDVNCHEANERLCEEFLKDLRVAGRSECTITSYAYACKDFLDFICGLNILQATHRDVRAWLHYLHSRGSASQTQAQRKYALGAFFKFLERIGVLQSSPTRLVPNRKTQRKLPRHHSVEEMKQLLEACDCSRDLAIISTLWSTGCRRAELLGMKIEDVNWGERNTRVIGKGDKVRLVPLAPSALRTLKEYVGVRERGAIFLIMRCSGQEKALGPRDLDRVIKKVCLRAGINATHPHAFRHTFATHMLEGGADLITVKEFLGHSSIISTQVYAQTSARFMRETMMRCHPAWTEGTANAQAK